MKRSAAVAFVSAALMSACGAQTTGPQRHLVFVHGLGTPKQSLWIGDANGTHTRRLIGPAAGGAVSPGGRLIAVERHAWSEVWTVRSDGRGAHRIARNVFLLDWLRDDRRILGLRRDALVTVDVETGAVRHLARAGALAGWSLSPNGRWIAFGRRVLDRDDPPCAPHTDLFVVAAVGGRARRLTHGGVSSYPVWGAPGIAFEREVPGCRTQSGIWRTDPDGSGLAPIARRALPKYGRLGYYGYRPYAWLPGGNLLIGLRNEWGDDAAILTRDGRVSELHRQIDEPSHEGLPFVGAQGGAEFPFTIAIVRRDGTKTVARGRVCCPDWNR